MSKGLRWTAYFLGGLLVLVLLAAFAVWAISSHKLNATIDAKPERLAAPSVAELADAPRQMRVMGCVGCHGEGLRGKKFLEIPNIVKLYAPNLTLVAARASDQQLAQGIRQGIGHDGRPLLVMPAEGYQWLSDGQVAAMIASIRALPKGGEEQPPVRLGPRGHLGIALGKFSTAPQLVQEHLEKRIPDFGPMFAAGKRLVEVNCAECHGPQLHGKELEPGVVSPDLTIAGAYDAEQFRTMMRTGVAPGGKDIGLMGRVAKRDFSHMTDAEIAAIHAYLVARSQRTN